MTVVSATLMLQNVSFNLQRFNIGAKICSKEVHQMCIYMNPSSTPSSFTEQVLHYRHTLRHLVRGGLSVQSWFHYTDTWTVFKTIVTFQCIHGLFAILIHLDSITPSIQSTTRFLNTS